ncbi:MAG TPA: (deoxy)nucleoside triphosphate pyrophosphohydrolase [Jatrophihabitans sp.]|uniref:(deoxy)nucleoside triphosphate pyrophosphohydrolase n=1 Tax=Jatrophihabitans sp. TaxID=1932789 RepID=UPI002E04DE1D|nr:(deoxy)nucleoside triphosphate pyrophosphohydrolase [Jatrophihabitans sp.]
MNVVAAAIVRDGRLLAARRTQPSRHAGGWEFPGGKVEAGEDDATALRRECHEELGVRIAVGPRLGEATDAGVRIVLYGATIESGEPQPLEDHDELRWLAPDELDSVPWLPIDVELLGPGARHLLERIRPGE